MEEKIIYRELCYKINGLCFQAQNELGRFCREKQYADRLEQLFIQNQIKYQREVCLPFLLNNSQKVNGNRSDFTIEDKIILDCKAKSFITKEDYNQMQRYLIAKKFILGLIVNFRDRHLKPKRVINYRIKKANVVDSHHSY